MTLEHHEFTVSSLLVSATDLLISNGYRQAEVDGWSSRTARLFEDAYGVVAVVVFETVGELLDSWSDLQGALVGTLSNRFRAEESKVWDGYLVLLTPSVSSEAGAALERIRYNTTRLRKMVATGVELRSPADLYRVLSGLLPIRATVTERSPAPDSALDALPAVLARRGVPPATTALVIDAFRSHQSILERLHKEASE